MKIKVELGKDESIEDAEEFMVKSIAKKAECGDEKYADSYLNQFHDMMCAHHANLVDSILKEVKQEIERDANEKGHL